MALKQALVVDDSVDVLDIVAEFLRENGWHVFVATAGCEALQVLDDHREVMLLLTDVIMPGISGIELAHRVREQHPHINILLMSGYTHHVSKLKVLNKPFRLAELLTAVEAVCKGK